MQQLGDPNCLHCAILTTVVKFTEKRRSDNIETAEVLESLLTVLIQIMDDTVENGNNKINMEKDILNYLAEHGYHWMRCEGPIQ